MKGHHLRDVLPPLPDKPMKQFTDHKDLNFIQERMFKLETFLNNMVSIPHVANMVCMKAFVGIMDQVPSSNLLVYTLLTDSCCIEMYIKCQPYLAIKMLLVYVCCC